MTFPSPLGKFFFMFCNIQWVNMKGVKKLILLLDSVKMNMFVVQICLHSNAEFIAKLVIFKSLVRLLSGSKTAIRGDSLEVRVIDIKQLLECLTTTSRFIFGMYNKIWRECSFGLQLRKDFIAISVKVRLEKRWEVNIPAI